MAVGEDVVDIEVTLNRFLAQRLPGLIDAKSKGLMSDGEFKRLLNLTSREFAQATLSASDSERGLMRKVDERDCRLLQMQANFASVEHDKKGVFFVRESLIDDVQAVLKLKGIIPEEEERSLRQVIGEAEGLKESSALTEEMLVNARNINRMRLQMMLGAERYERYLQASDLALSRIRQRLEVGNY